MYNVTYLNYIYPILLYTLSFEEIDGQLADYFNFKMGV